MKNKTVKFVFTAYLISWSSWGILALLASYAGIRMPQPLFMVFFILGGLGPTIAPFITINPRSDKESFLLFRNRLFKWSVNPLWYLFLLIVPFMLLSIPWLIDGAQKSLLKQSVLSLLTLIPANILFGGLEEIGWRGVLLPGLMKRFPKMIATLLTSLIWTLWHLPLWFVRSSPQETMDPVFFVILGLCFSFLLTTVYIKTGSLFLCILLHSIFNSYPNLINIPPENLYRNSVIMLAFAIIVLILCERVHFVNRRAKV